jgi:hypothetical protein
MGVLRPVIQILRPAVLHAADQPSVRHRVTGELVGDQHPGHVLQAREQLAEEPGGGLGVAPGGDQDVQHGAVLIHRPPQVLGLAVDLDEYLIEVPLVPWPGPSAAQSIGVGLAERSAPLPNCLVGNHDPALQHHLLDVTEAQRETVVQPDAVADDLRREAEPPV